MIYSEDVRKVFLDCLYEEESNDDFIIINGIINNVKFNKKKINDNKNYIENFIEELPNELNLGMSFLDMCKTNKGDLWTGEHRIVEQLLLLGLAINKLKFVLSKEHWSIMPFGMPYVILK